MFITYIVLTCPFSMSALYAYCELALPAALRYIAMIVAVVIIVLIIVNVYKCQAAVSIMLATAFLFQSVIRRAESMNTQN